MSINSHLYPYYPKKMVDFRGLPNYAPRNLAFEGEAVQGGGCGFGKQLLQSGMGEFIERRHFFSEVPIDAIGKIHDYNCEAISQSIYGAINQIKKTDPLSFITKQWDLPHVSIVPSQHPPGRCTPGDRRRPRSIFAHCP